MVFSGKISEFGQFSDILILKEGAKTILRGEGTQNLERGTTSIKNGKFGILFCGGG